MDELLAVRIATVVDEGGLVWALRDLQVKVLLENEIFLRTHKYAQDRITLLATLDTLNRRRLRNLSAINGVAVSSSCPCLRTCVFFSRQRGLDGSLLSRASHLGILLICYSPVCTSYLIYAMML